MAVADLTQTIPYTKINVHPSKLSYVSTRLSNHRRIALRPFPQTRNARICCSVTSNQVEAPVAVQTQDPKKKPECFGVFCLTYDLKANYERSFLSVAIGVVVAILVKHCYSVMAVGFVDYL
ncbi:unnamed protein product, partial [Ilex paraguariensis]